ncbi:uncharacterized protein Z520_06561 [Fonsecaea multimorphosa CBS 102226]|uniref:Uncharacterized protein n=1 Tax=Fonsecaea multimorphosa CBS 102226 TaxID=1442371 RepID=A0A0D2KM68_9EURO|nr:uncharacterized protein Z520_06561 [Fonsecaea multimorphosa CBS 102226]KIX97783.1 hypothetical protein Z520_06561 [Fonsecaea multimorphosa CBS 102226]OAL23803.1 hypothetical protein AYO22_06122 [Fonsecaea multimorphosa]
MNPYNQQPYGFPQQTPGPPQPPWQVPPRRQGWGDPRLHGQQQQPQQPQSPASPYHAAGLSSNAFGPPLPPPPPSQYPPPPQFDAHQWGVRYNQGLGAQAQNQHQEPKPALPPRPSSATGRISPQPHQTSYSQQPPSAPSQQQYGTSWNDPYHTSTTVPPPPPPRPAEYQAQIQAAHHNRTGTPHQEYSYQPPTHHYDPPALQQNAWSAQHGQPTAPPYHPTPPPMQQTSGVLDGPLVSPIDSTSGYWSSGHQAHSSTSQAPSHYNPPAAIQTPDFKPAFSQALGFGGPSDWEHYDPNAPPPEQTPTSPPPNPLYQDPISPPRTHATLPATYQTPKPEPVLPTHAVEIGLNSPVSPRKDSRAQLPPRVDSVPSPPSQPADERPSSAGQHSGEVSARSDSLNGTGIDSVIQAWNAPLNVRSAQDSTPRPESRASAPRVTSPEPGISPVSVKVIDPYADLEPEFKASLKRYAAMLRKEAEAETDDDKFEIFQSFVNKELRLRSLLYGVELKKEAGKEVKKAASLADIQAILPNSTFPSSGTSKGLDRVDESVGIPSDQVTAPSLAQQSQSQPSINTIPEPAQANTVQREQPLGIPKSAEAVSPAPEPSVKPVVETRPKSKDGPHVIIPVAGHDDAYSPGGRPLMTKVAGGGEEQEYSPGGRPVATKPTDEEGETYSPGGRPIAAKPVEASSTKPSSISTVIPQQLPQRSEDMLSPSNDAPMVIEDYATPGPPSPSVNAPIVVIPEAPRAQDSPGRPPPGNGSKPVVPIKFEPARPAYTPFRYNAGVQEEKSKTLKPADQAYSSLRNSVADSGRLMAQDTTLLAPVRPSSTTGKKEHEEAFIGLIRKQSMAVRQKTPGPGPGLPPPGIRPGSEPTTSPRPEPPLVMRVGTPATASTKPQQVPADPLKAAVTALRSLLPPAPDIFSPIEANPEHPKLKLIKSKIDSIPDAFTFIHDTVVEWDRTNRLVRKEQEAERQARQEESEGHIDALFNDNEIGYADIGELEAEFKLKEAEKRFDEDQAELESFTSQVFVAVTERLQKEIAELMTAYTMAVDLLDIDSLAVSRCFKANDRGTAVRMTEVMSYVLTLFNKIEIRHTKVAEAHVERERRRKHLELTVLYTNGDVQGVKKLEKEFAVAEKMAVLHEARGRDNRANKLMDSFDRATVRGLGDNQVFTDEVLSRLQDIKRAIDAGAVQNEKERLYEPDGARDTLSLAQNALDTVMADSRRLLALSNEADVLLNDADYNVSVAEARVANADKPTYTNLENEKAKEDAKLFEEMNVRTSSVTKGPQEGISLIREMVDRIGDDPAHQERIKKALEKAKMRNANGASNEGG